MYRTHNCGELCKKDVGINVILSGWIKNIRNFGSLLFIDIRDYFGITQLICDKKLINNYIGKEFVIQIYGKVKNRISINKKLKTGDIEVIVSKINVLNTSIKLPFIISDKNDGKEEERMKYRYLDIRCDFMKKNIILRHKIIFEIRNYFYKHGFIEIETPILINYTPEGANSFLTYKTKNSNKFYSLSQSPQIFKQLLMMGGIDKYFQIVKCFRNEDGRSDRQIEFTQIDCEMSFVTMENILCFFEKFIRHIFKIRKIKLDSSNFPRISYKNSIEKYGTDNPDIRYGMSFINLNKFINKHKIPFLICEDNVIGIIVKLEMSDTISNFIKNIENQNLIWIYYDYKKNIIFSKKNFFNFKHAYEISKYLKINPGYFIFISYGRTNKSRILLKNIRDNIINIIKYKKNEIYFKPVWIINSPLFKLNKKHKIYKSVHHPFTNPKKEYIKILNNNPDKVLSESYDLVINGIEIGSGSIRINNAKIQKYIFKILGFSNEEIHSNFGFFIKALKYGAPPHGGIAFGLDRLISLMEKSKNIKNFIAFPKNNLGEDIMTGAPSYIKG